MLGTSSEESHMPTAIASKDRNLLQIDVLSLPESHIYRNRILAAPKVFWLILSVSTHMTGARHFWLQWLTALLMMVSYRVNLDCALLPVSGVLIQISSWAHPSVPPSTAEGRTMLRYRHNDWTEPVRD